MKTEEETVSFFEIYEYQQPSCHVYLAKPHLVAQVVLANLFEGSKCPNFDRKLRREKTGILKNFLEIPLQVDWFISLERTKYHGSENLRNFQMDQVDYAISGSNTNNKQIGSPEK